jgi:hypothetical protein
LYDMSRWKFNRLAFQLYVGTKEKYCAYYGSEHTSNHSQFVIDLQNGFFYRKCFSPNCQNTRQEVEIIKDQNTRAMILDFVTKERERLRLLELRKKNEEEGGEATAVVTNKQPKTIRFSEMFSGWKRKCIDV